MTIDDIPLAMNKDFFEGLYQLYQQNPQDLPQEWQEVFSHIPSFESSSHRPSWARPLTHHCDGELSTPQKANKSVSQDKMAANGISASEAAFDSVRAIMMIRAFRVRGHLNANLDPLQLKKPSSHPELDPASYGFSPKDWDRPIFIDNVLGLESATVRQILKIVNKTYCGTLGVEFMHIAQPDEKSWIQQRVEGRDKTGLHFSQQLRQKTMRDLIKVESFEKFLGKKYVATKRFGLDGAEMMILAVEWIINEVAQRGVKEVVIGMAHRGRLNLLAHILEKPYQAIFREFQGGGDLEEVEGSGDVKYHLGDSEDRVFSNQNIHLSLAANPSHLECVDAVVLGRARGKQDHYNSDRSSVLPLLLHGDAAFAGQGIVAECLGLSGLRGHRTGGTIHFIINNQIGFTTSPIYARSSPYPSDVGKMVEAPIFHVNGDDPEMVFYAAQLASEFRQTFLKPVIIDMFCYRRFGHNEIDNPEFTQPLMYRKIKKHPTIVQLYEEQLIKRDMIGADFVKEEYEIQNTKMETAFQKTAAFEDEEPDWLEGKWEGFEQASGYVRRGQTASTSSKIKDIIQSLCTIPQDFDAHPIVRRVYGERLKMVEEGAIDWACAEALAFGTLLCEGYPIRLVGQDCERGTFSQRHSVLVNQKDESQYIPLNNLDSNQKKYEVVNSMLSEEAVLGFEYGYSQSEPNSLVLWEAQFGDFANTAQAIFDQFICSGEEKWLRMSGLVMLLPHGYEGQGPEHSSARLERYLQACAEDNIQVANCTTPANYFHILRRQIHRNFRKPLILMTPKSLLRHKLCVSPLSDLTNGSSFHRILADDADYQRHSKIRLVKDKDIQRVIICSGKVYYDLLARREEHNINDVYLLRLEQFYPFPNGSMKRHLTRFANADMVWCQEEPKNMGGWFFVKAYIEDILKSIHHPHARLLYAGRPEAAAVATGFAAKHKKELEAFLQQAFSVNSKHKYSSADGANRAR